jgi:HAE1 family hydrophobic/amphiphilic exporter-1
MQITRGAVSRPILTSVVALVVITLGLISYSRLSIDLMPEVTFPTISVITNYGNVGPLEIEEMVTRPLEESLAAVQGVEEITSTSSEGRSVVRVAFGWGKDLDEATNDIRDRIDRVMGRLPDDVDRPQIRKFDVTAFPIITLGVSGTMSALDLRRFVEDQIKYRLERIPGVAAADIRGGRTREIQVNLRAERLRALGVSADAVLGAIRDENRNTPAGSVERGNFDVLVRTQGEYRSLDEIGETTVALRGGNPVRVRDVAEVVDSYEETNRLDLIDGKPSLTIAINKQSGANTVTVAEAVREEVGHLGVDFPLVKVSTLIDTSTYIRRSIDNIGYSLLIGGLLAVLVLFFFLRNISSTLIISTAIPISVIFTFALMYSGGLTLNTITFGGLALGIGMLLDSSIVVLENIYRHREEGSGAVPAALDGASEVGSAIVASTLTTVVVFLPVVFMQGISGVIYKQMAYVVGFSLFCALVVAVTLIPVLSSRFLRFRLSGHQREEGLLQRIYAMSAGHLALIEGIYGRLLGWALRHRPTVVLVALALFSLSVFLVGRIGVELMPAADESEVRVSVEMAVGTKLERTEVAVRAVEEIVRREVPETQLIISEIGGGGFGVGSSAYTGQVRVRLVPIAERKRSSAQVANDLRGKVSGIPGVTARTQEGRGFMLLRMGSGGDDRVSIEIRGYNLETARALARKVQSTVKEVAGITDVRISRAEGSPEQVIRIDRARAADLGLSVNRIGEALRTAVGGSSAGNFRQGGKEYPIRVRLGEGERRDLADLLDLTVPNSRGQMVALGNVVSARPQEGPVRVERKDQERIITVNANFADRDMGAVIADIREALRSVTVPKEFALLFGGDYEEQQKAYRELIIAFILALFLVYLVMAGQFESYRDPFIVLFAIPMALIGITATMLASGTVFSIQAFIGCIMLAGIVVNNAILLVDYTNQLRRLHGKNLVEAVTLAGSRRLRPILMTTLTTCLGLLPLSLGIGEGGEAQAPMARVVIGGLASATLVTLVLVPVVYSIFEGIRTRR